MNKKNHRVPTNYAYSRKQKRAIAKRKMKEEGKKNFCKHSYSSLVYMGKTIGQTRESSFFADHWREYVNKEVTA